MIRLLIEVNEEQSNYKASGNMTSGDIKILIGEMEFIKNRLLFDLERSLDDGYTLKG